MADYAQPPGHTVPNTNIFDTETMPSATAQAAREKAAAVIAALREGDTEKANAMMARTPKDGEKRKMSNSNSNPNSGGGGGGGMRGFFGRKKSTSTSSYEVLDGESLAEEGFRDEIDDGDRKGKKVDRNDKKNEKKSGGGSFVVEEKNVIMGGNYGDGAVGGKRRGLWRRSGSGNDDDGVIR